MVQGLLIGIFVASLAFSIVLYLKSKQNRTNGVLEVYDQDPTKDANYRLVLFDPLEEWSKLKHLSIRVDHKDPDHAK